jgi:pyruvate/2-oxoglutarate dehydrogenase complex dihydrolipoamide acyltransferase (E2) component
VSIPDGFQHPPLRYKRFGGGYRREDVEVAFSELGLTLRQLGQDLESLRVRNHELEGELATARSEIDSYRAKENELWQTMSAALRGAADIEEGAAARAREIVAQAEEEALRLHAEASRRLEDSNARFNELLRLKDNLLEAMRRVVGDFGQAISRVERGEQLFPGVQQDVGIEHRPATVQEAASPAPAADAPASAAGDTTVPISPLVSVPSITPPSPAAADESVFEIRPSSTRPVRP